MTRKFVKAGVFWGFPGSLSSVQSLSRVQLFATPWATNLSGNHPANAGDFRDTSLILRLGRSSGVGNGNPLQYSCLGNPMERGTWWALVHTGTETGQLTLVLSQPVFHFAHSHN